MCAVPCEFGVRALTESRGIRYGILTSSNTTTFPNQAASAARGTRVRVQAVRAEVVILASVVLGTLALYGYTTVRYGHTFFTSDAYLGYTHAHSWYFDGDADYANNMLGAPGFGVADYYAARQSSNGHVIHFWPCGWSIVALPFVALADVATLTHNAIFQSELPRDGFSVYYRAIVPLGHVFLGIAGLLAAYALAARYVDRPRAAVATGIVWLGTNVGYFISVEHTMTHAASMSFVTMMLWVVDTIRISGWNLRRAMGLGVCAGMMMAVRHQNIVWIIVPAAVLLPQIFSRRREETTRSGATSARWEFVLAGVAVAVACVCLVPQVLTNLAIEGVVVGAVRTHMPHWSEPRFWTELLDPRLGLLRQYPLAALCVVGLVMAAVVKPPRLMWHAWLGGFALLVYLHACWPYGVGHTRRYVCCAGLFVLGLGVVLEWASRHRGRVVFVGMLLVIFCTRNVALQVLVDRQLVARHVINNGGPLDDSPRNEDGRALTVTGALWKLVANRGTG